MGQLVKVIDVTRSYIPGDPNTFPETYHATNNEDYPETRIPVVPFEGWNFMPTAQGYRSYFGLNKSLNISNLISRVDDIFMIQTQTFDNILVALCEDGIWTKTGEVAGNWDHVKTLSIPPAGKHLDWTYCVIGKNVYAYRATGSVYYKFPDQVTYAAQPAATGEISYDIVYETSAGLPPGTYHYSLARRLISTGALTLPSTGINVVCTNSAGSAVSLVIPSIADTSFYRIYRTRAGNTYYLDVNDTILIDDDSQSWTAIILPDTSYQVPAPYTPSEITPTFLNMAGQLGIFRAGIRLGFWDSENSIAWSSIDDLREFTPSIETLAGSAVFTSIVGRITTIKDQANGFLVYATKSIVFIKQVESTTFQWDPIILLTDGGVAFAKQITKGNKVDQQFAITSLGLAKIESAQLEIIVPEITDFLSKTTNPLYLALLNNRYLCIQSMDDDYVNAQIRFTNEEVHGLDYSFPSVPYISDLYPDTILDPSLFCSRTGLMAGLGNTVEQQADAQAAWEAANSSDPVLYPPPAPGSSQNAWNTYEAVWEGHLQVQDVPDPNNITWTNTPCSTIDPHGVERNMCPSAPFLTNTSYGVGANGTLVLSNRTFSLKQLVQMQMALWGWEDSKRSQYINAILSRVATDDKTTVDSYTGPDTYSNESVECSIGTFISGNAWINEKWAANKCSFWIERKITEGSLIKRRLTNIVSHKGGSPTTRAADANWGWAYAGHVGWNATGSGDMSTATMATLIWNAYAAAHPGSLNGATMHISEYYNSTSSPLGETKQVDVGTYAGSNGVGTGFVQYQCLTGSVSYDHGHPIQCTLVSGGSGLLRETMFARNIEYPTTVDVTSRAFFKLVGWKYKDAYGVEHIVPGITDPECKAPDDPDFTGSYISGGDIPVLGPDGSLCGDAFPSITIPGYSIDPLTWPSITVTLPSSTFLLQHGSIGPIYPTYKGSFVYDLLLKKWGKLKADYKQLLDYVPINSLTDATISADDFRIQGGLLNSSGAIYLFDESPSDSRLTWGKVGYYRQGMTKIEEVQIHNSLPFTGNLELNSSIDGDSLETYLTSSTSFSNVNKALCYPSRSGRWHTISVIGKFDIKYLEFRGTVAGRR